MSAMNLVSALLLFLSNEPSTTCFKNCTPSEAALQFTARFEGYSAFTYGDPVGIKTIGHGHVIKPGEHIAEPLLPLDAYALLQKDAAIAAKGVNRAVAVPLRQSQFDALNDFQFNTGALGRSTLLKKVNSRGDVSAEFAKWVYAQGKRLAGLVVRRQAEAELYGR